MTIRRTVARTALALLDAECEYDIALSDDDAIDLAIELDIDDPEIVREAAEISYLLTRDEIECASKPRPTLFPDLSLRNGAPVAPPVDRALLFAMNNALDVVVYSLSSSSRVR